MEDYTPISGKTYSLFGENSTTQPFYQVIRALTDEMLAWYPGNEMEFLEYIHSVSRDRRLLRRSSRSLIGTAGRSPNTSKLSYILKRTQEDLSVFLEDVEQHIGSVPLRKRLSDKSLLTIREQYYLYMIEFELVNRMYSGRFREADVLCYYLSLDPPSF